MSWVSGSENLPRFGIFGGRVSPSSLFSQNWERRGERWMDKVDWYFYNDDDDDDEN